MNKNTRLRLSEHSHTVYYVLFPMLLRCWMATDHSAHQYGNETRYYGKILTNDYDKVMCISRYLGGDMTNWFESHQREWLELKEKDWQSPLSKDEKNLTDLIFKKYTNFEEELRKLFGEIDEE